MSKKTEHDGYQWTRENVGLFKSERVKEGNPTTVRGLKLLLNSEAHAKYDLMSTNCHRYAFELEFYIRIGEDYESDENYEQMLLHNI